MARKQAFPLHSAAAKLAVLLGKGYVCENTPKYSGTYFLSFS